MTGFVLENASELILFGFAPLFATVATVWIIWYVLEKNNPDEVTDIESFLTLHHCGYSVCDARLRRTGNRDLRRDDNRVGWFAVLAFGVILADDLCWGGYLYRPNSVAMVALAQTQNPSKRDTTMRRGGSRRMELLRFSALTPGSDSARHDRQGNPTGGGSYHLADDRDDVEAIQGWDQELEDFCANNSAYSSRNRISGGT
jgi:hypothetical protein